MQTGLNEGEQCGQAEVAQGCSRQASKQSGRKAGDPEAQGKRQLITGSKNNTMNVLTKTGEATSR